jgi:hypothetical protein
MITLFLMVMAIFRHGKGHGQLSDAQFNEELRLQRMRDYDERVKSYSRR